MSTGGRAVGARVRTWGAMLRALVLVALAELSVRRLPVDQAAERFGMSLRDTASGGAAADGEDAPLALSPAFVRHRRATDAVLRHWPFADGPCLRRSLALGWAFRSRQPRLCLGARFDAEGTLLAHAWVEVDGVAIGRQDAQLTDLSR